MKDENKTKEQLINELAEIRRKLSEMEEPESRRKQTSESHTQSEQRLKTLVETIPHGIQENDPKGIITFSNPAHSRMHGYKEEELVGKAIWDMLASEKEREELKQYLETLVIEQPPPTPYITQDRTKDGRIIDVQVDWSYKRDKEGKVTGFISVITDVTERKRTEEELRKSHKLESLGILAGGIAHDFNNLLTGILGNIYLAKLAVPPRDNIFKILTEAEKASLSAKELTKQLLTFSKGGEPVRKTISVRGLIKDWCSFTLRGSRSRHECIIPDDLWPVEIEEGQIHQVISNIITNADQAMPSGGVIKVQAENITVDQDHIHSLKKGRYVKISIEDQGRGIPEEQLQKIFDPYFTTKERVSGLGLAIAYSIIKNHHGYIYVESEPGVKTIFYVYIPASCKEVIEEKDTENNLIFGKGKILVVDDEEIVRDFTGKALRYFGYVVEFAKDGTEAIESYRKARELGRPFDAVIMDLTIPGGLGGAGAIKELLNIDPEAKVIVSSGYSKDPVMANYGKYGFKGILVKPYTINGLSEVVHRVIKDAGE